MRSRILNKPDLKGRMVHTHQLFIQENEDIMSLLENYNIAKPGHINYIIKNTHNSKVGYYQFPFDECNYYKIYILPKTIELTDHEEILDNFKAYLLEYQRLSSKYKSSTTKMDNHIEDYKLDHSYQNIDDIIADQYIQVLSEIYLFFRKHSKEKYLSKRFTLQNISEKLDIRKNIRELDKSRIHQVREYTVNSSDLAYIAEVCLNYFISSRLLLITNKEIHTRIKILSQSLRKLIKRKFYMEGRRFTVNNILNNRIQKIFASSASHRKLYNNLLFLVGTRDFDNNYKICDLVAVFYSPEYLYEMVVQEYLEHFAERNNFELRIKPTVPYQLRGQLEDKTSIQSIPDFILVTKEKTFIIDAKWKVVNSYSSIAFSDVLKLDRDAKVHCQDTDKEMLLVYPSIELAGNEYQRDKFSYSYDESINFRFGEIQVLHSGQSDIGSIILETAGSPDV